MPEVPGTVAPTVTDTAATTADDTDAVIDTLIGLHGRDRGALLPILQDLRAGQGEISELAMQVLADRLGVAASEIQGVVTFYSFLGMAPRGRHVIRLCRTLSCAMAGTRDVAAALQAELGIGFGDTTPDGEVTLEWANCIGLCDTPPAALVDDQALGGLTPDQAGAVIGRFRTPGPGRDEGGVRG